MKVVLTHRQYQSARYYGSERHELYFERGGAVGKRRWVEMPPAAWRALARRLEERSFTDSGRGRTITEIDGLAARSALSTITRAVTTMQVHPAMRSEVVIGSSTQQFLVWAVGTGTDWQPWPHAAHPEPYLLEPRYEPDQTVSVGGRRMRVPDGITYWRAYRYAGDVAEHLGWNSLDEDEAALAGEDQVGLQHHGQ